MFLVQRRVVLSLIKTNRHREARNGLEEHKEQFFKEPKSHREPESGTSVIENLEVDRNSVCFLIHK